MDWQAALRARLLEAGAVAAIVGDAVFWGLAPQGVPLPRINLNRVSGARAQDYDGFSELQDVRVQIDARAGRYQTVRDLQKAVLAALTPPATRDGVTFARAFVESERDLTEQTAVETICCVSTDVRVWWRPQ